MGHIAIPFVLVCKLTCRPRKGRAEKETTEVKEGKGRKRERDRQTNARMNRRIMNWQTSRQKDRKTEKHAQETIFF